MGQSVKLNLIHWLTQWIHPGLTRLTYIQLEAMHKNEAFLIIHTNANIPKSSLSVSTVGCCLVQHKRIIFWKNSPHVISTLVKTPLNSSGKWDFGAPSVEPDNTLWYKINIYMHQNLFVSITISVAAQPIPAWQVAWALVPTPPTVVAVALPQVHALAAATIQPPGASVVAGAAPIVEVAAHIVAHKRVATSTGGTAGRIFVERVPLLALVIRRSSRPAAHVHLSSAVTITIAVLATTSRILHQKTAASGSDYHTVVGFFHESGFAITAAAGCRSYHGGYSHTQHQDEYRHFCQCRCHGCRSNLIDSSTLSTRAAKLS